VCDIAGAAGSVSRVERLRSQVVAVFLYHTVYLACTMLQREGECASERNEV